jgi:hypothetical protein
MNESKRAQGAYSSHSGKGGSTDGLVCGTGNSDN